MSTPLTKKPGEFRATCRQGAWVLEHNVPVGTDLGALMSRWDRKLGENVYAVACELDTTDRAEYLAHMAEVHGKKPRGPAQLKRGRGMWRSPKLEAEGKTLVTRAEVAACSCGLVAEMDGSQATELWWTEHLRGCAIVQAAS